MRPDTLTSWALNITPGPIGSFPLTEPPSASSFSYPNPKQVENKGPWTAPTCPSGTFAGHVDQSHFFFLSLVDKHEEVLRAELHVLNFTICTRTLLVTRPTISTG